MSARMCTVCSRVGQSISEVSEGREEVWLGKMGLVCGKGIWAESGSAWGLFSALCSSPCSAKATILWDSSVGCKPGSAVCMASTLILVFSLQSDSLGKWKLSRGKEAFDYCICQRKRRLVI